MRHVTTADPEGQRHGFARHDACAAGKKSGRNLLYIAKYIHQWNKSEFLTPHIPADGRIARYDAYAAGKQGVKVLQFVLRGVLQYVLQRVSQCVLQCVCFSVCCSLCLWCAVCT